MCIATDITGVCHHFYGLNATSFLYRTAATHTWVWMRNRSLVRILLFATVKRETATRVTQSSFTTLDTGWGWVKHKHRRSLDSSSSIAIGLYVPSRYPLWGTGALCSFRFQLSFGMLQLSSANYSYTQNKNVLYVWDDIRLRLSDLRESLSLSMASKLPKYRIRFYCCGNSSVSSLGYFRPMGCSSRSTFLCGERDDVRNEWMISAPSRLISRSWPTLCEVNVSRT